MAGLTNRGKYLILSVFFRGATPPATFYAALVTDAVAPTADTNTLGELTEIASGNGYTAGGIAVARNAVDFTSLNEDDALNEAALIIKNLVWTAAGGSLPASASGARYMVLTTDEATLANRQIVAFFDLVSPRVVSDTQSLTIQSAEISLTE